MEERQDTNLDPAPVLIKWAVKHDDIFNMPEYVQGTFIGIGVEHNVPLKNGEFIRIHDVEVFDLHNKILKTSDGQKFYLSGEGKRIFMVDNEKINELYANQMNSTPEDLD